MKNVRQRSPHVKEPVECFLPIKLPQIQRKKIRNQYNLQKNAPYFVGDLKKLSFNQN
jgi:hypothetical protein